MRFIEGLQLYCWYFGYRNTNLTAGKLAKNGYENQLKLFLDGEQQSSGSSFGIKKQDL